MLTLEYPGGIVYQDCAERLRVVCLKTLDHEFYRCVILITGFRLDIVGVRMSLDGEGRRLPCLPWKTQSYQRELSVTMISKPAQHTRE